MINALNFPLSLFLSIVLVPILMRYAGVLGLVDRPDGNRKIHTHIIPKSGGLAIALAVSIAVFYSISKLTDLVPLLLGSLVIVISGLIDDRYDLNFKWKFLGQIIAITIFLVGTPGLAEKQMLYSDFFSGWLTYGLLFIFLLGVSNAINLSDGLDGLAAGITMISLGLVALLASDAELDSVFIVAMAVMGALMGFLRYNTHPAQVFMGDTGSQFIGFTCAALAIYLSQNIGSAISPVLPILILGVPILDTLMVMSVRIYNGKSPFYPDKNHIHHQLMKFGFRHYEAVAILYLVQIALVACTYFLRYQQELVLLLFYGCFALLSLGLLYFLNRTGWKLRQGDEDGKYVDRRNPFFRGMSWIYEYSSGIITFCFCLALTILFAATLHFHMIVIHLALVLLVVSLAIGIILRNWNMLTTRMLSYTVTVLMLYDFAVSINNVMAGTLLNIILYFLGIFILLAIRMTRKHHFQLNNQDLIILFILLVGPLLPFEGEDGVRVGVMLFRVAVMIYAIEYVISKSEKNQVAIKYFSALILFIMCFI